jgi:transposase
MGRPKLEPIITQRIVDLIRAGNFLEVAATASGIHKSTLHRWLRHGRKQVRGRYRKFLTAVEKAQAESESRDVALIAKAASEDWRAAAWRLERKVPRRYGARVQLAVQQELDAVLGRLEKGLPTETYEQVLQLMASEDDGEGGSALDEPIGTLKRLEDAG